MATKISEDEKVRFDTRLPKEQKLFFERAVAIGGYRNLADFIILAAQEKAKEIIKERETIIASKTDSEIFFDAIMKTSRPNKSLTLASKEYKKLISK
jgi:uncharacterized protein (DUF1778 family)